MTGHCGYKGHSTAGKSSCSFWASGPASGPWFTLCLTKPSVRCNNCPHFLSAHFTPSAVQGAMCTVSLYLHITLCHRYYFPHLRDVETKAQRDSVTSLWPHSISKRYHCEDAISLLSPGNHLGAAALVLAPH